MGLNIVVGVVPELYFDEAERAELWTEFALINRALRVVELPEHREPVNPGGDLPWNCRVGSWICFNYLRRVAAYLALGKSMPDPAGDVIGDDPVIDAYYDACVTRQLTDLCPVSPETGPTYSGATDQGPTTIALIAGPGFEHLMWHSDCTGYYLPTRFHPVIVLPSDPRWDEWGPWLGSSQSLLEECQSLADALGYPRDLDIEELRQYEAQPTASDWRRYAIECFMCQVLITACQKSIESGCAVVLC